MELTTQGAIARAAALYGIPLAPPGHSAFGLGAIVCVQPRGPIVILKLVYGDEETPGTPSIIVGRRDGQEMSVPEMNAIYGEVNKDAVAGSWIEFSELPTHSMLFRNYGGLTDDQFYPNFLALVGRYDVLAATNQGEYYVPTPEDQRAAETQASANAPPSPDQAGYADRDPVAVPAIVPDSAGAAESEAVGPEPIGSWLHNGVNAARRFFGIAPPAKTEDGTGDRPR